MKIALAALAAATFFAAAFTGLGALAAEEPSKELVRWRGGFDCEAAYEARDIVYYKGSSYVAREAVSGCVTPQETSWDILAAGGEPGSTGPVGPPGADGAAGTLGGNFQSPDGNFNVSVTNSGITLEAPPEVSIKLTPNVVQIKGVNVSVQGATTQLSGTGATNLGGGLLALQGSCAGVARMNDMVTGQFAFTWYPPGPGQQPWPDGPMMNGRIMLGSQTVKAC